jgi:hypothetical protein
LFQQSRSEASLLSSTATILADVHALHAADADHRLERAAGRSEDALT